MRKHRAREKNPIDGAGVQAEDSTGRIDLLLLRGMEMAANALDAKTGQTGTWNTLGGVVEIAVNEYVPKTRLEIPPETKALAALFGIK